MEKLKNHHGKNSVLVVRPADAEETTVCWRMAMENIDTPTALIFSRQNIDMLPEGNDYNQATKGAYVVKGSDENYDVILLASGSEVATLEAGAKLLREEFLLRVCSAARARSISRVFCLQARRSSASPLVCLSTSKV